MRLEAVNVVIPIEYVYEYGYGYGSPKLDLGEGTLKANASAAFRGPTNILLPFCVQFRPQGTTPYSLFPTPYSLLPITPYTLLPTPYSL